MNCRLRQREGEGEGGVGFYMICRCSCRAIKPAIMYAVKKGTEGVGAVVSYFRLSGAPKMVKFPGG